MRKTLIAFLFAFMCANAFAAVDLDSKSFKEEIGSKSESLVMLYRNGCGWCDRQFPVLAEFEEKNKNVFVAKIDAEKNSDLREELKIFSGTPTFIKFVDGKEVGGWVGFVDLQKMEENFKNPKPLDHSKPMPQMQRQNGETIQFIMYHQMRLENRLAITQLMCFVCVVVAFFIGRKK